MGWRQKFDVEELYAVGDLHFSHKNLVRGTSTWENKTGTRDFDTIEQMNETIIKSINDTVPADAVLINLGDMLFGDKSKLPYFRKRINCKKILYIYGNHCGFIRNNKEYQQLFDWCGDYLEIFAGSKLICCFHYSCKIWNESHRKSYHLFGHSHGNLPSEEHERSVDVGWDVWKRPISFIEIDKIMSKKKWVAIDHHNERTF